MYTIRGADQKEYGPVSLEQVRQWIAQRRATGQTFVQTLGTTDWRPLSELPEFAEALASAGAPPLPSSAQAPSASSGQAPGTFSAPAGAPPGGPQNKGLATASLVLGILSLTCLWIFAGIPAIITGHLAQTRARRSPREYGGGGLALAGLIMGYVSVALIPVVAILAGLMLPALAKTKAKAQSINCVSNMKQIGLAARMWANDNTERFPTSFMVMSNELGSPRVLICPADAARRRVMSWDQFDPQSISYEFVTPGLKIDGAAAQTIVFRCPIHGHTGLGDGSVHQTR